MSPRPQSRPGRGPARRGAAVAAWRRCSDVLPVLARGARAAGPAALAAALGAAVLAGSAGAAAPAPPDVLARAAGPAPSGTAPAILPLAQITQGMTGIGKTVVLGTQIVEFRVRVLGVLTNGGPAGDLVLFQASGPAIERVGGLAAGMSGSPIYLGGRLAGAFSYTFQSSDPFIGLFTPIEDMLRDLPAAGGTPRVSRAAPAAYAIAPIRVGSRVVRRIVVACCGRPAPAPREETLVAVPAATPLFLSGFRADAQETLARAFGPMGLVPMQGSGQVRLPASLPIEPGSAIGVALMQGEITAYAIGTLSYRSGDRILAFGHPFTGVGRSGYLLTNATIFQTIKGRDRNIKVGAAGSAVGIVSEDRPAAIGGLIGTLPRMFGVHVHVADPDARIAREFTFQVVPARDIAPALVLLGSQAAVERALNRSGAGTAQVRMVLRGRSLPHPIVRENLFFSSSDIATRALSEVSQAMSLLFDNEFSDVRPTDMDVNVSVTDRQQTGVITDIDAPRQPVAPGSELRVRVTVRPFRGDPKTQDVTLTVPRDLAPGTAMLTVRAGGAPPLPAATQSMVPGLTTQAPRTLEDAITAFEQGEKNTDVVVEIAGAVRPAQPGGTQAAPQRATARWTTPWVLRGRFQAPVTIAGGR